MGLNYILNLFLNVSKVSLSILIKTYANCVSSFINDFLFTSFQQKLKIEKVSIYSQIEAAV